MNGQEPFPELLVRPIRPDDSVRLQRTFERLSPETIYRRFFSPIHTPPPGTLHRLANVDHDNREALVVLDGDEIIAVGRWERDARHPDDAELALLVEDAWQRRGVGRALTAMLVTEAGRHRIATVSATVLSDNVPIRRLLATSLGPPLSTELDGAQTRMSFRLAV
ncbi:MAG TPA: GNAT family N-acetyltransferase [Acidimicrobiales bacterium]|nr:GNAT family N-acetyltransferase [Acidimicrobiales bacterium]